MRGVRRHGHEREVTDDGGFGDQPYVAITVGLTFQVSDTDLRSGAFRRLAIQHMLLSYLMGAVIIAITIDLVAGLTK